MSEVTDISKSGAGVPSDQLSRYAGLADWVYHRDTADQGFGLGELGYDEIVQIDRTAAERYGFQKSEKDGFIYNAATGFTAAIVEGDTGPIVVFRGTDLAAVDKKTVWDIFTTRTSGPKHDYLDIVADRSLGQGVMPAGTQAQDVMNLMELLKAKVGSLENVTVVGQSLGGGLAGLASAVYGVRGVLIDPAPFRTELMYLAAARALEQTSDGNGGFLRVSEEATNPNLIDLEIVRKYDTPIWREYKTHYQNNLSRYEANIALTNTYFVKDEVLRYGLTLAAMGLAGAKQFSESQPTFDTGALSLNPLEYFGIYRAVALHNPTFFALAARSEAADSSKSFAKLLKDDAILRDIFIGDKAGIAGAPTKARSDDPSISTTSRVTAAGPDPSVLQRAFFKSIGTDTDLYVAFHRLVSETMATGAVSERRGGKPTQPSLYGGVSKLALGVMRDVVANTSTIDEIKQKTDSIDLNFSGEERTDFFKTGSQTKVVVNIEDIEATGKDFVDKDGLAYGVGDINRVAWNALIKGGGTQVVEKALDITTDEVFGPNAKGLPWKVVVAQAGTARSRSSTPPDPPVTRCPS